MSFVFSLVAVGGIGSGGGGPAAVVNSSVDILMPSLAGDLSSLSMNDKQPLMNNTVSTTAQISALNPSTAEATFALDNRG